MEYTLQFISISDEGYVLVKKSGLHQVLGGFIKDIYCPSRVLDKNMPLYGMLTEKLISKFENIIKTKFGYNCDVCSTPITLDINNNARLITLVLKTNDLNINLVSNNKRQILDNEGTEYELIPWFTNLSFNCVTDDNKYYTSIGFDVMVDNSIDIQNNILYQGLLNLRTKIDRNGKEPAVAELVMKDVFKFIYAIKDDDDEYEMTVDLEIPDDKYDKRILTVYWTWENGFVGINVDVSVGNESKTVLANTQMLVGEYVTIDELLSSILASIEGTLNCYNL